MTNAIINSVARLARAGDANSAANAKLLDAAVRVGEYVAGLVGAPPRGCAYVLPRGYVVAGGLTPIMTRVSPLADTGPTVPTHHVWNDVCGSYTKAMIDLDAARHLAQDVADGWLSEVTVWLEERAQQAEHDAATLEGATEGATK